MLRTAPQRVAAEGSQLPHALQHSGAFLRGARLCAIGAAAPPESVVRCAPLVVSQHLVGLQDKRKLGLDVRQRGIGDAHVLVGV